MYMKAFEVRWSDLDANRHLANSAYTNFMSHARMSFLIESGLDLPEMVEQNLGPVVFFEHMHYLREVLPGTGVRVSVEVAGLSRDGMFFEFHHNFYDHRGNFVEGYYLVGLIAQTMLRSEPGGTILYDPRLTWNTEDLVTAAGGRPVMCKTGHAYFKQAMRRENAVYGGEMSAHHYFREFSCCDTGMLPWLMILVELSQTGRSLADLVEERIAAFPCSGEINFRVADTAASISRVAGAFAADLPEITQLDGLSMAFEEWRFNLRGSNTEPLLRLNVESRGNPDLVSAMTGRIGSLIAE
mgnify:CR=1 FL=1